MRQYGELESTAEAVAGLLSISRLYQKDLELRKTTELLSWYKLNETKLNSVALVRVRTMPTDRATAACWRSSANFCG
jgi:hypothetical protein